ncbi:MAG: apolipoprotein N-acyltransferase, partial [Gammaproteobacteria bacterium]|nr:apolipoprotein N-acyltransferase [Gammaproteobacteria bacterium]
MYRKLLTALLAGAILPLAFAPFYLYPIAVISPALLIYCWLNVKPAKGFLYSWLYGIGCFGVGVSWVYISIHRFGGLPVPIASLLTALFVMVLALFPALQGYLVKRWFPQTTPAKLLLAVPASFALIDWLRSWLLSGFPWLLLGYSQTNSPLKGYAPILGEYGLSFIITLTSGLLVFCWLQLKTKQSLIKLILPLGAIAAIWLGGYGLTKIAWTQPTGKSIKVSLIQGNIPQQLKWQADFITPTLERYSNLTNQHWDSDLIIWPEAAVPITYQDASEFLYLLGEEAKQHHTRILLGIPFAIDDESFYNALYVIGEGHGHYYKRQLVPFGEYLPFHQQLTWLFNYWQIPMSNLLPGPSAQAALK